MIEFIELNPVFLMIVGAVVSIVLEYVIEPLIPAYRQLDFNRKRAIIAVVVATVSAGVIYLNCSGLLPSAGFECPAAANWLEWIVGAVMATVPTAVGSQAAHMLAKKPPRPVPPADGVAR